ncbi:hypothetical protein BGZ73_001677, partial [Actinomortierella ambigua]
HDDWILGIDPGQACVVGAYMPIFLQTKNPDSNENATVGVASAAVEGASQEGIRKARCLKPPLSTSEETKWSISKIETALPHLHGDHANFEAHVQHRNTYMDALDTFYNGNNHIFKRHRWFAKAGRAEEFSRLADALLRMVGGTIGEKKKDENKVVIGVRLGRFQSTFRLTSLDQSFMTYFVKKVRSLGYLVVDCNEYYSSKRCPKCENFDGHLGDIRRTYCRECEKYMHRDAMAAHNMVNVLRAYVERQERPDYLQPVDDRGQFPWKDGYEHVLQGTEVLDAPKSTRRSKRRMKEDNDDERGSTKKAKGKKRAESKMTAKA